MPSQQEQKPEIIPWDCKVIAPKPLTIVAKYFPEDTKSIEAKNLTVGQSFEIQCTGSPVIFEKDLVLSLKEKTQDPDQAFLLQLKEVIYSDEKQIRFQVVSFVPGKHKLPILISDINNHQVESVVEFEVESLLASQPGGYPKEDQEVVNLAGSPQGLQSGQAPNPYPGFGSVDSGYPNYLWYSLAAVIFLVLFLVFLRIRKKKQERAFELRWKESQVSTGNYKEFLKNLRHIERKWQGIEINGNEAISKIYQELRLYLFREFKLDNKSQNHKAIELFFRPFLNSHSDRSAYKSILILLDDMNVEQKNENIKQEIVGNFLKELRLNIDKVHLRARSYR